MNRRELLAGASAAGSALAGIAAHATPTDPPPVVSPDAMLIRACQEHDALADAFEVEPFEDGPAYAAWRPVNQLICDTEPQTVEGLLAKARLAVAHSDQWGIAPDGSEFFHSDAEHWGFSVLMALVALADEGKIGGTA